MTQNNEKAPEQGGEKILCAAIWYNDGLVHVHQPRNIETGYVMCGRRHHNIINLHFDLTSKQTGENSEQGFLTSKDRFVNRKSAALIATDAGQVKKENLHHQLIGLFSEDLY